MPDCREAAVNEQAIRANERARCVSLLLRWARYYRWLDEDADRLLAVLLAAAVRDGEEPPVVQERGGEGGVNA